MVASEAKEREIRQLLWNLAAYHAPYGGGVGYDTMKAMGQYGPGGLVFSGAEFRHLTGEEKRLLRRSLLDLLVAMGALEKLGQEEIARDSMGNPVTGFGAWLRLAEPYVYDPVDPSKVGDWREKAARGSVVCRRFADEHDAGVRWLAEELKHTDLYPVFPKLMTEDEEKKMEDTHAEICAVFYRLRSRGVNQEDAYAQTGQNFHGLPADRVRVIVEVRSGEHAPTVCREETCEKPTTRYRDYCVAHYHARRRALRKGKA